MLSWPKALASSRTFHLGQKKKKEEEEASSLCSIFLMKTKSWKVLNILRRDVGYSLPQKLLSSPEGRQHFKDKRSRRTDCGALGHHHSNQPNNSARCELQVLGFPVCLFSPSLSSMATLSVPGWRQLSLFPLTSKLPSSGEVHLLGMERDRAVLGNTWKTPTPISLFPHQS